MEVLQPVDRVVRPHLIAVSVTGVLNDVRALCRATAGEGKTQSAVAVDEVIAVETSGQTLLTPGAASTAAGDDSERVDIPLVHLWDPDGPLPGGTNYAAEQN